jgi:hypothetical protein
LAGLIGTMVLMLLPMAASAVAAPTHRARPHDPARVLPAYPLLADCQAARRERAVPARVPAGR